MHKRRSLLMAGSGAALGVLNLPAWSQANLPTTNSIRVAAASDLQLVLPKIAAGFEKETGLRITLTFGASGNLARQLAQGLPADLFMSADEALVMRLQQSGWARDAGAVYALGRLAWLARAPQADRAPFALDTDLRGLHIWADSASAKDKFAIANPDHAPYGRAAKAALEKAGLWQAVQPRLVLGENVSQTAQFVSTGAAQAALVALSLAAAPELAKTTRHVAINPALHPPILQRMALHSRANAAAQSLYAYLQSNAAKTLLKTHYFE